MINISEINGDTYYTINEISQLSNTPVELINEMIMNKIIDLENELLLGDEFKEGLKYLLSF